MQFLVSMLVSIILGYRAKQRGKDGLKFGAGVAVLLMASSAVLGFWDQAVGTHPALWWVLAAFVVAISWLRLDRPGKEQLPAASTGVPPPQNATSDATVPKPWSRAEGRQVWSEGLAWAREHKLKAAGNILLVAWVFGFGLTALYRMGSSADKSPQDEVPAAQAPPSKQSATSPVVASQRQGLGAPESDPVVAVDQNGFPVLAEGKPIWHCQNLGSGGHWRSMQFRDDGVYVYRGQANGWGRYRWDGESKLHMTADENDMWMEWNVSERSTAKLAMANRFGLQVRCQRK